MSGLHDWGDSMATFGTAAINRMILLTNWPWGDNRGLNVEDASDLLETTAWRADGSS